ncbi:hypothetical protein N2152v2_001302 [Parachlorella kessleri]
MELPAVAGSSVEQAQALLDWANGLSLEQLMSRAAAIRDEAHATHVTFSPKVFIPLTRLCRDSCGYCTFAQPPAPGRRAYMTVEEVVAVARLGAEQGCTEALFTLGDKPELLYPEAAAELAAMGYGTTLDYVAAAAAAVLQETGLLPHINAGTMGREGVRRLRRVSVSQGLMLESCSRRLLQPGGPHYNCPDKDPALRLATLEAGGQEGVPFTTGILIGIGETRAERLEALLAVKELHERYGHIQEVIVQNFRAKKGTAMAGASEPPLEDLLWTLAMARVILGPATNIQAPPNLTPEPDDAAPAGAAGTAQRDPAEGWRLLLAAGINDWGGVSPVTRDWVNPEKPWPHLQALARATAEYGRALLPRLPVYPFFALRHSQWMDGSAGAASPAAAALRLMDSQGLARGSAWCPGLAEEGAEGDPEQQQQQQGQVQQQGMAATDHEGSPPSAARRDGSSPGVARAGGGPLRGLGAGNDHGGGGNGGGRDSSGNTASSGGAGRPGQRAHHPPQQRSSMPAVRRRAGQQEWKVVVGEDGLLEGCALPAPSRRIQQLLEGVLEGSRELGQGDIELLFRARGGDFAAVCIAADQLRRRVHGERVTYVVNRNINYTNVCTYKCQFCAFSKGKAAEELRGAPYLLPLEEISRRAAEAWERGATEVCMQGGIHPDFTGETYLRILDAAKSAAPGLHVHAFSPLEVWQGAATLGWPLRRYLQALKDAGLGSLPGTAAEVLDDAVRAVLCPDKLSTAQWVEVVQTAHAVGLDTTSTIMFGHCEEDGPASWARHLLTLRAVQQHAQQRLAAKQAQQGPAGGSGRNSGGGIITEFVPLPFVHMEAPIYLKGRARRGPTLRECILMHAVSRLALHPHITNIQASWVKMGPHRAARLLAAGCNDMGGSLMNESITRAAGAAHGQELPPQEMERVIRAAGRVPVPRTTLYGTPPAAQTQRSLQAGPLQPLVTGTLQ